MNFKSASTALGGGYAAYASADGDVAEILLKEDGAIKRTSVNLKTKAVKDCGVFSYADECLPTNGGRIETMGERRYAVYD